MSLFAWIRQGLWSLLKGIALPFAKLGSARLRPYVRWTAHVCCVAAILACLAWLNHALDLEKVVRAPWSIVRAAWLPLLFSCVYALTWLGWWLWHVATSPAERSPFPDLDEAWSEGLHALEQARIDLSTTPVFLLIGGAAERMNGLLGAMGFTWEAPLTPKRNSSALRLCATQDAIFIDLSRACASGRYAERLTNGPPPVRATNCVVSPMEGNDEGVLSRSERRHLDDLDGGVATKSATASNRTAERGLELIAQSLALLETEQHEQTETQSHLDGVRISEEELDAARERLAYVCQLLAIARAPYCPANGVLTLVSWEATATQATANRAAVLLDRDLATINAELQIAAPRIVLITDIEAADGGADLIARIPPDQRQRRFGVRFPRLSAADGNQWPRVIAEGVAWLTRELLPALVYRVLQCGGTVALRGNAGVFRFLNAARQREARLVRLLERGLLPSASGGHCQGVFFAAGGEESSEQHAFLAGVMPQILEMQNDVAWLPHAIHDDARNQRWTRCGYAILAAIVVGLAVLAITM